jgi:hypothetical protein
VLPLGTLFPTALNTSVSPGTTPTVLPLGTLFPTALNASVSPALTPTVLPLGTLFPTALNASISPALTPTLVPSALSNTTQTIVPTITASPAITTAPVALTPTVLPNRSLFPSIVFDTIVPTVVGGVASVAPTVATGTTGPTTVGASIAPTVSSGTTGPTLTTVLAPSLPPGISDAPSSVPTVVNVQNTVEFQELSLHSEPQVFKARGTTDLSTVQQEFFNVVEKIMITFVKSMAGEIVSGFQLTINFLQSGAEEEGVQGSSVKINSYFDAQVYLDFMYTNDEQIKGLNTQSLNKLVEIFFKGNTLEKVRSSLEQEGINIDSITQMDSNWIKSHTSTPPPSNSTTELAATVNAAPKSEHALPGKDSLDLSGRNKGEAPAPAETSSDFLDRFHSQDGNGSSYALYISVVAFVAISVSAAWYGVRRRNNRLHQGNYMNGKDTASNADISKNTQPSSSVSTNRVQTNDVLAGKYGRSKVKPAALQVRNKQSRPWTESSLSDSASSESTPPTKPSSPSRKDKTDNSQTSDDPVAEIHEQFQRQRRKHTNEEDEEGKQELDIEQAALVTCPPDPAARGRLLYLDNALDGSRDLATRSLFPDVDLYHPSNSIPRPPPTLPRSAMALPSSRSANRNQQGAPPSPIWSVSGYSVQGPVDDDDEDPPGRRALPPPAPMDTGFLNLPDPEANYRDEVYGVGYDELQLD